MLHRSRPEGVVVAGQLLQQRGKLRARQRAEVRRRRRHRRRLQRQALNHALEIADARLVLQLSHAASRPFSIRHRLMGVSCMQIPSSQLHLMHASCCFSSAIAGRVLCSCDRIGSAMKAVLPHYASLEMRSSAVQGKCKPHLSLPEASGQSRAWTPLPTAAADR